MTEEHRVVPVPNPPDSDAAPTLPDLASVASSQSEAKPASAPDDAAGAVMRPASSDAPPGARKRARLALRIPDDEVVRPLGVAMDSRRTEGGAAEVKPAPAEADGTIVPRRIITINPPSPLEVPEAHTQRSSEPDGEEVRFDDDAAMPLTPRVSGATTAAPLTPRASGATKVAPRSLEVVLEPEPDRRSDPGEGEIFAEDLVAIEATPAVPAVAASLQPMRQRLLSPPPAPPPPASKKAVPSPQTLRPSKPPLVIVPPHMGSMSPQAPDSSGQRRKGRFWWEELFNDDYLRAAERITDAQLAGEVDFIEQSLCVEPGGAVLDLACGTGRQAVELAKRGYQVVGFDLSLAMLARASDEAQERSTKLNFVQGDMREMTFSEQFDGVYCWNTSFGYFEEEKNALVVDRIHASLKGGGLLLLDVVNRDFLVQQAPSLVWFEGDGCVCMDEMVVDYITSRMRIKRTMMLDDGRSREIEYSLRVYSLHELGKMLHEHGFKVCEVSGRTGTPGVFFGHESPRTIVLAEKR